MGDIWWIIKSGDEDDLADFVAKNKVSVDITNESGRTPAHVAADYNHVAILKFLHSKGAKMDLKDKNGITPLLCAVWEGHVGAVEFLLSIGANPKGTAPDGKSYLECAESDEVKKLLKAKSG